MKTTTLVDNQQVWEVKLVTPWTVFLLESKKRMYTQILM